MTVSAPTSTHSPTLSSVTVPNPRRRSHAPAPAGTTRGVSTPSSRSEGEVEMIVMQVRDQHRVESANRLLCTGGGLAAQVRDAAAQQRVGEQAHAVEFDQDGGVAEENDTVCGRARATGSDRAIDHGEKVATRCLSDR